MNKLTENSIRKAQILEKQYKIYDGEGMFLLIHPNGSKYWRMKYTFDGKSKLASFGVWPGVSLKEARENFEKEYLTTQLKKFGGNISKTAKFVGMERSALHRKLKGLGVKDLN